MKDRENNRKKGKTMATSRTTATKKAPAKTTAKTGTKTAAAKTGTKTAAKTGTKTEAAKRPAAVKTPQVEKMIAPAEEWKAERPEEEAADLDPRGRERVFLLRKDGKFLSGVGYGGAGKPVPYWTEKREEAKTWKTISGIRGAEQRFRGEAVEELLDPVHMVTFLKVLK